MLFRSVPASLPAITVQSGRNSTWGAENKNICNVYEVIKQAVGAKPSTYYMSMLAQADRETKQDDTTQTCDRTGCSDRRLLRLEIAIDDDIG